MASLKKEKISSTISLNSMAANIVSSSSSSKTVKTPNASSSKKKSTSLPAETVDYLKAWMMSPEHIAHPYPTEQEKSQIMVDTGIELKQLTNWFVNNRKRFWKPRVEAQLQHNQVQGPLSPPGSPIKKRASGQQSTLLDAVDHGLVATTTTVDNVKPVTRERSTSSFPALRSSLSQALVSDASSSASCTSDSGSVFSSSNDDEMNTLYRSQGKDEIADGTVARCETVDVHILRPLNGIKPTIADVSILSTVPEERILFIYENRTLTYRFPLEAMQDRKKVQNRRDGEIVRMKRRYLKLFLEESGNTKCSKRRAEEVPEVENSPRKRFCLKSPGLWKEACEAAADLYDTDLPTLEEATLLFGFSRGICAEMVN